MSLLRWISLLGLPWLFLQGCGDPNRAPQNAQVDRRTVTIPEPRLVPDIDPEAPFSNAGTEDGENIFAHVDASPQPSNESTLAPQQIYRPDDTRVAHDDARLKELGIERYESQRLILYTDINPEIAKTLPPIVDAAYETLVEYFGPPPPARSGAEFQVTGYLIKDRDRFRSAGLIPDDLNRFDHGQHRGQEFWMYEQEFDYYRRHLLIHELTHCLMLIVPGLHPPIWYLEGMAEFFATHRIDDQGHVEFGVMPENPQRFVGFSRIEMIQEEVATGRFKNLDQTTAINDADFAASRSTPYAWSWALCNFLDSHPRYQERFRRLGQHLVGKEFFRLANELFAEDKILLAAEWDQFVHRLDYGWDYAANAFVPVKQSLDVSTSPVTVEIAANRGWQSTGIHIVADNAYSMTAAGRVELAQDPKPWVSEPQGISIQYASGKPIGRLLVGVLPSATPSDGIISQPFEVHDCGRGRLLRFETGGALFMFINDDPSDRQNNSGTYQVRVGQAE